MTEVGRMSKEPRQASEGERFAQIVLAAFAQIARAARYAEFEGDTIACKQINIYVYCAAMRNLQVI